MAALPAASCSARSAALVGFAEVDGTGAVVLASEVPRDAVEVFVWGAKVDEWAAEVPLALAAGEAELRGVMGESEKAGEAPTRSSV